MKTITRVLTFNSADQLSVDTKEIAPIVTTSSNTKWLFFPFEVFSNDVWIPAGPDSSPVAVKADVSGGKIYFVAGSESRINRGTAGVYWLNVNGVAQLKVLVFINAASHMYIGPRRPYAISFPLGIDRSAYDPTRLVWIRVLLNPEYAPTREFGLKLLWHDLDVFVLALIAARDLTWKEKRDAVTLPGVFDQLKTDTDTYRRIEQLQDQFVALLADTSGRVGTFKLLMRDSSTVEVLPSRLNTFKSSQEYTNWRALCNTLYRAKADAMAVLLQYNDDTQPVSTEKRFVFDPSEFPPTTSFSPANGPTEAVAQSFAFLALSVNNPRILCMYELHFLPNSDMRLEGSTTSRMVYSDFMNAPLEFRSDEFDDVADVMPGATSKSTPAWFAVAADSNSYAPIQEASEMLTTRQNTQYPAALTVTLGQSDSLDYTALNSAYKSSGFVVFLFEYLSDVLHSYALGTGPSHVFQIDDIVKVGPDFTSVVDSFNTDVTVSSKLPYTLSDTVPLRRLVAVFTVSPLKPLVATNIRPAADALYDDLAKLHVLKDVYALLHDGVPDAVPPPTLVRQLNIEDLRRVERDLEREANTSYGQYLKTNPLLSEAVTLLNSADTERLYLSDILAAVSDVFQRAYSKRKLDTDDDFIAIQVAEALDLSMKKLDALLRRSPGTFDLNYSNMTLREIRPAVILRKLSEVFTPDEQAFVAYWHYPRIQTRSTTSKGLSAYTGSDESEKWLTSVGPLPSPPEVVVPSFGGSKQFIHKTAGSTLLSGGTGGSGGSGGGGGGGGGTKVATQHMIAPDSVLDIRTVLNAWDEIVKEFTKNAPVQSTLGAFLGVGLSTAALPQNIATLDKYTTQASALDDVKKAFKESIDALAQRFTQYSDDYLTSDTHAKLIEATNLTTLKQIATDVEGISSVDAAAVKTVLQTKEAEFTNAPDKKVWLASVRTALTPVSNSAAEIYDSLKQQTEQYDAVLKTYTDSILPRERAVVEWTNSWNKRSEDYLQLSDVAMRSQRDSSDARRANSYMYTNADNNDVAALELQLTTLATKMNALGSAQYVQYKDATATNAAALDREYAVLAAQYKDADDKLTALNKRITSEYNVSLAEFKNSASLRGELIAEIDKIAVGIPRWLSGLRTILKQAETAQLSRLDLKDINSDLNVNGSAYLYEARALNGSLTQAPPKGAPIQVIRYFMRDTAKRASLLQDQTKFSNLVSQWASAFSKRERDALSKEAKEFDAKWKKAQSDPNAPEAPAGIGVFFYNEPFDASQIPIRLKEINGVRTLIERYKESTAWLSSFLNAIQNAKHVAEWNRVNQIVFGDIVALSDALPQRLDATNISAALANIIDAKKAGFPGLSDSEESTFVDYKDRAMDLYSQSAARLRQTTAEYMKTQNLPDISAVNSARASLLDVASAIDYALGDLETYFIRTNEINMMSNAADSWRLSVVSEFPAGISDFGAIEFGTTAQDISTYLVTQKFTPFKDFIESAVRWLASFSRAVKTTGHVTKWNSAARPLIEHLRATFNNFPPVEVPRFAEPGRTFIRTAKAAQADGYGNATLTAAISGFEAYDAMYQKSVAEIRTLINTYADVNTVDVASVNATLKLADELYTATSGLLSAHAQALRDYEILNEENFQIEDWRQQNPPKTGTPPKEPVVPKSSPKYPAAGVALETALRNDKTRAELLARLLVDITTLIDFLDDSSTPAHIDSWRKFSPDFMWQISQLLGGIPAPWADIANLASTVLKSVDAGVVKFDPKKYDIATIRKWSAADTVDNFRRLLLTTNSEFNALRTSASAVSVGNTSVLTNGLATTKRNIINLFEALTEYSSVYNQANALSEIIYGQPEANQSVSTSTKPSTKATTKTSSSSSSSSNQQASTGSVLQPVVTSVQDAINSADLPAVFEDILRADTTGALFNVVKQETPKIRTGLHVEALNKFFTAYFPKK